MIYGYIRVSSDKQTTENQEFEIKNFMQKQNILIESWIKETISSTKELDKRKLGKLLKKTACRRYYHCFGIIAFRTQPAANYEHFALLYEQKCSGLDN